MGNFVGAYYEGFLVSLNALVENGKNLDIGKGKCKYLPTENIFACDEEKGLGFYVVLHCLH